MSTPTVTERDPQSFAEAALRLSGKTEEEARRTGAVDKADEQVEALFSPQYQTVNSPVHQAVWAPARRIFRVAIAAVAAVGGLRCGDGPQLRNRPPSPGSGYAL